MQVQKEETCLLFSSDVFPQTSLIKNKSAIPWGVGIHPLNPKVVMHKPSISQLDIPRCQKCYGYLNMYCSFDSKSWRCPLCQFKNKFDKSYLQGRYATSIERSRCEECIFPNISLEMPISRSTRSVKYSNNAREVLVFVFDCTANSLFLDYSKQLATTIISHYHEQADILLFTSGNRLGMYNIKHALTKILYSRLISSTTGLSLNSPSSISIPLQSIMSFEECSAPLTTYRQNALHAVNAIQRLKGEFCFAETLQLVIDFLYSVYEEGLILGGKVFTFINENSTNPAINPFQDNVFPPKTESDAMNRLSVSNPTYSQIITRLQKVGLSLDVINNITDGTNRMNPALLQQLTLLSNGNFHNVDLHNQSSKQAVEQYARSIQYSEYGFDCLFRVRSSGGVSIHQIQSNSNVNSEDVGIQGIQFTSNSSNVNHLSFINSNTVVPFDFQYTSPSGSSISDDDFALIQLVTEYTTMTKKEKAGKVWYEPVRRMLISTVEYKLSSNVLEIYKSCNPSVIIFILLHKTFRDLQNKGFEESRFLLKEWLLSFLSHYMSHIYKMNHNVEYDFNTIPKLAILPRYIYSCMIGNFLRLTPSTPFSLLLEEQTILLHLTPSQLSRYLYPQLSGYKDENTLSNPILSLSTRTVLAMDRPIYLYVGYQCIIVYYWNHETSPPSQSSKLGKVIQSLCEESIYSYPLAVHYWCQEKNSEDFDRLMIDDNADPQFNYSTFDNQIKDKAIQTVIKNKS